MGGLLNLAKPVWLAGALNPPGEWPRSLDIGLADDPLVSELHFAWGTTEKAESGLPVARLTVQYADGASEVAAIRYATEIFAFEDTRGGSQTTIFWTGETPIGTPAAVRSWKWVNPRPGVKVRRVTVTSLETEAAPVVLGLTALQPGSAG